jgi:hypothetical protein
MIRLTGEQLRRRLRVAAVLLLALAALLPGAALAAPPRQGTLDPAVLAAIQSGAATVFQSVGVAARPAPGPAPEAPPATETTPEAVPTEEAIEEPPAEATAEPTEELIAEPTPEPTEAVQGAGEEVEVENAGVNLLVPGTWETTPGEGEMIFAFSDPGHSFEGVLNTTTDFPGLILFPILERTPELLAASMGEGVSIEEVARFDVEQGIPAIRLGFAGADSGGGLMDGAIYVYGPGEAVYMMFAAAPAEEWASVAAEADLAAASILFDEELVTLQTAGDEGLEVEDPAGAFRFTAPPGWSVTPMNMAEMPFTFTDPDISVVGLAGAPPMTDADAFARALAEATAGNLSEENAQALIAEAIAALDIQEDGLALDDTLTDVYVPESGEASFVVRMGGEADLGDGLILPMTLYVALNADRAIAFVLIGEPDVVLALEDALRPMVESAALVQ